ncbi:MAG TPA: CpsB/CapC family capsule biosynthesis tyrosine phosphatase [Armatimonadota bacterium]|jgi:protein-tyrosine phosphatase
MIDIHSHILPGVDDGPATMEESLAMAQQAVAGGTTIMFATPHIAWQQDIERAGAIAGWVATLQDALVAANIPLQIIPGAEVSPLEELLPALEADVPLTLGVQGKYLLLDSPFTALPMGFDAAVFALQTRGYNVILAHPERLLPFQMDPAPLAALANRGLLMQVNASSLLGKHGVPPQKLAWTILRHGWAHFVASDAHSPIQRRPGLTEAAREVTAVLGEEVTAELFEQNPRRILAGEPIACHPAEYTAQRKLGGWFDWLRRR